MRKVCEVSYTLKANPVREGREIKQKARAIITDLSKAKMRKVTDLVKSAVDGPLACNFFHDIYWHKTRTDNPVERIMSKVRPTAKPRRLASNALIWLTLPTSHVAACRVCVELPGECNE